MATRSASLNPASMPFFPGGRQSSGGDDNAGPFGNHGLDRGSLSSVSVSQSEYRSARSSPSPSQHSQQTQDGQRQQSPPVPQFRESPTFRQLDSNRASYSQIESRRIREGSMLGPLDTLPEVEDTVHRMTPAAATSGTQTPNSSFYSLQQRSLQTSSPIPPNQSNPTLGTGSFKSVSPVSSLNSGSHDFANMDPPSLETQLQSSPIIGDILARLQRCEYTNREILRELTDVQRKVNLLIERAVASQNQGQPEFKDPFSSSINGSGAVTPLSGIQPRPSMGNIAPNQMAPVDDVGAISQRLNLLTNSVGQLLAIQTAQLQQSAIADSRKNSTISLNTPPMEVAPNQVLPNGPPVNHGLLGHGLPNRPDLRPGNQRQPNPPIRTWSTGAIELPPVRPAEQNMQRGNPMGKRNSVASLMRRDSSGIIDPQTGETPRDGPVVSKWEHLALSPELLRSLNKFGIGPPNKIQQRALPFLLRGSDIIAQAPPTQERIAAYVIPAIQVAVTNMRVSNRGPLVIMISTTVDQATQAQRMIRDLGGPIGVRSALGVGTTNASGDLSQELRLLQQNMPHIICGTPQKLHALFTSPGGLIGSEVRFLVLDEVDQLIARNLHDFVFSIVKLLPPPRSRPVPAGPSTPVGTSGPTFTSPFEPNNPTLAPLQANGRRFSAIPASPIPSDTAGPGTPQPIERQTALFSNTVPQDVLNLATAINLREPVRVLVRRDGGNNNPEQAQTSRGLRQYYLYLAFTATGRSDPAALAGANPGGLGIIGSGRGVTNAEATQAREWKLDALADLFQDIEINQAIVHVGSMATLEAVVYKLVTRGLKTISVHAEMNPGTKLAALNKFKAPGPSVVSRGPVIKVLVVYDVQVKSPEVTHVPLVVNYDLPKAVEEYSHRVTPAVAPNYARAGVVINFVTATGGDVEMLRSIECFYKIKCPEVPMSLRDIL